MHKPILTLLLAMLVSGVAAHAQSPSLAVPPELVDALGAEEASQLIERIAAHFARRLEKNGTPDPGTVVGVESGSHHVKARLEARQPAAPGEDVTLDLVVRLDEEAPWSKVAELTLPRQEASRAAAPSPVLREVELPVFKAAWWLPGGTLQTLWMDLGEHPELPPYRREHLGLPDGGELVLDHIDPPEGTSVTGRVLVLHGLEGHSGTQRNVGLANVAAARGYAVTVINLRGCATIDGDWERFVEPTTPRLYYSGDSADLDFVVRTFREREPGLRLGVAAVSWGAGTLLRWLGEQGKNAGIDAAVAIGAPYDLARSGEFMNTGLGKRSVSLFLKTIVIKLEAMLRRWPELAEKIDIERIRQAKTFNEIDDLVWAPMHGFASAADFHAKCSSLPVLGDIAIPTLSISAANDPLNPASDIERAKAAASPHVRFEVTRGGGHAAQFAGRTPWTSYSWNEEAAGLWFDAYFK